MSRWPIRQVSRDKLGDRALSDKVHKATLHTMAGRAGLVASEPHWEQLRTRAREARVRALDDHDGLLARFCDKLEARGVGVTVAKTPAQACEHITRLVLDVGIRVTKSKSMTSETVGLNAALQRAGVVLLESRATLKDIGPNLCPNLGPLHARMPLLPFSLTLFSISEP
jgi:L-lactate dehydrogenase complex protein LldF